LNFYLNINNFYLRFRSPSLVQEADCGDEEIPVLLLPLPLPLPLPLQVGLAGDNTFEESKVKIGYPWFMSKHFIHDLQKNKSEVFLFS